MFVDFELANELRNEGLAYHEIDEYIEDNGIWYTFEEVKKEIENNSLTLEDAMEEYYFIVIKNEIKFCFPGNIFGGLIMSDLDKEILYWIEQFGYTPKNTGKLIDYIKENWVVKKSDVVEEFVEMMKIKNLPSLHILDWNKICSEDDDYEELESGLYLNVYQLENSDLDLKRLDLII